MTKGNIYLVRVPGRDALHIRDGKKRVSTGEIDVAAATSVMMEYIEKSRHASAKKGRKSKTATETLGAVLDEWSAWKAVENPKAYGSKWTYLVARLKRRDGSTPLISLDHEWSQEYVSERKSDGVEEPTIRQELSLVSAAWKRARRRGIVSIDPIAFEMPRASHPRSFFLTQDEARRLITSCNLRHLRLFVTLGFATGGRPGAILDLTWSRVDLEKGLVDLRNAETTGPRKKAARVPVGDDVLEELRAAREISVTRHVIEFCGKPINSVSKSFSTAVTKAGLDPQTTPHILRHSAATWMAQAGVDFFEIAGFLGHTSVTMVERVYGHHHPDFMKSAMRAVSLKL